MPAPTLPMQSLLELAFKAGEAILRIYEDRQLMGQFTHKDDASPLTLADSASHEILMDGLRMLTPHIPVISEEGDRVEYDIRKKWEYFWCIDPLDGSREFLSHNNEFTVNIALIEGQDPLLGIIHVPVAGTTYYGPSATGAWRIAPGEEPMRLDTDRYAKEWTSVGSRSHASQEEKTVIGRYPVVRHTEAGSSLKFCLIAEGKVHLYYRHGPTMEWDTAAGHAIVKYSGGGLCGPSGEPFLYNKESLVNGPFLCAAEIPL